MHLNHSVQSSAKILEQATGIVIPVHLSQDADPNFGLALLRDTVHGYAREVAIPAHICLSVDGPGPAVAVARQIAREFGTRLVLGERNRGKLLGTRHGMAELLGVAEVRYLAVVDQDGDHFANELLNFVRAAEHVAETTGNHQVLVLGDRLSRHRPLGFLRGEQEELADRILLDALQYDAVICDRPLPLQFANALGEFPDFHSGYKLFSRDTAEAVFLSPPNLVGLGEDACYRHACEAVMVVESIQHGAILATVSRRTYDVQPISLFSRLDRRRLAADMILWPCRRLAVPGPFVAQWLANHMHRLHLATLAPGGQEELLGIRDLVLAGYGQPPVPGASIPGPRFL